MTTLLTALVGIIGVLNLLLLFGVIRRLKEHELALAKIPYGVVQSPPADSIRPPGSEVGEFSATTTDGVAVDRESLAGPVTVGFFSVSCAPCTENAPKFAAHAAAVGGREHALAIVVADGDDDPSALVGVLGGSARVVVEGYDDALVAAFGVTAFPSYAVVAAGRITATAIEVSALPVTERV